MFVAVYPMKNIGLPTISRYSLSVARFALTVVEGMEDFGITMTNG